MAGLGWHLALIAIAVFAAYLLLLSLKSVELHSSFLHRHAIFSTFRLFKLSMLCGLVLLRAVTLRTRRPPSTSFCSSEDHEEVRRSEGTAYHILPRPSSFVRRPRPLLFLLTTVHRLLWVRPHPLQEAQLAMYCHASWFYRLSGVFLDLLAISSVASIEWAKPLTELSSHDGREAVFRASFAWLAMAGCLVWNVCALRFLSVDMFPNFHLARSTVLLGDSLGHSWAGLLIARAYDPLLQTPVPFAFASKMLISLPIPGSSGKNQFVMSCIEAAGLPASLLVCAAVLTAWIFIHGQFLRPLWPRAALPEAGMRDVLPRPSSRASLADSEGSGGFDDDTLGLGDDDVRRGGDEGGGGAADEEEEAMRESLRLLGDSVDRHGASHGSSSSSGVAAATSTGASGFGPFGRAELAACASSCLGPRMLRALRSLLSPSCRQRRWEPVYALARDGAALQTLLTACPENGQYMLVVEDSWGYVFGAFLAHGLTTRHGALQYYGTGESWLFSFHNKPPEAVAAYRWTQANELFTLTSDRRLALGGGGGFALILDDELDNGQSNPSATYGNPRLSSTEFFKVLNIEVFRLRPAAQSVAISDAKQPAHPPTEDLLEFGEGDI